MTDRTILPNDLTDQVAERLFNYDYTDPANPLWCDVRDRASKGDEWAQRVLGIYTRRASGVLVITKRDAEQSKDDDVRVITDDDGNCPECHHPVVGMGADCEGNDDKCPCLCSNFMIARRPTIQAKDDSANALRYAKRLGRIAEIISGYREPGPVPSHALAMEIQDVLDS